MNTQHQIWMMTEHDKRDMLINVRKARSTAFTSILVSCVFRLLRLARRAHAKLRRARRQSANYRALNRLSDTVLKDIGLNRSEILYAVTAPDFEEQRDALRNRYRDFAGKRRAELEKNDTTVTPLPLSIRNALKGRKSFARGILRKKRRLPVDGEPGEDRTKRAS